MEELALAGVEGLAKSPRFKHLRCQPHLTAAIEPKGLLDTVSAAPAVRS